MESKLVVELASRPTWLVVFESFISAGVTFTAFFGNVLVCLAVLKKRQLRLKRNYFVISLAIADALMAAIVMPLSLGVFITGRWVFDDLLCQTQGTVSFMLAVVSQSNITMIAINRYVKMTKSTNLYNKMYTEKTTIVMIVLSWIFSPLLSLPYFLIGSKFKFHPGKALCFFDLNNAPKEYTVLLLCVIIPIPFCIIIFCYYNILKTVRIHASSISHSAVETHGNALPFVEEMKLTKVLFAIVVAFTMCWLPLLVIDLINLFQGDYNLPRWVYVVYINAAAASSSVNPLIYACMNREFRKAFQEVLWCRQ